MGQQNPVLHIKLFSVLLRLGELASAIILLGIFSRFVYLIGIANMFLVFPFDFVLFVMWLVVYCLFQTACRSSAQTNQELSHPTAKAFLESHWT
ncbi:Uncharacterized protein HZ326_24081 [Fusarium oxysporum f. sp. albedinis]|nr:Uncharacterized protein HZ326_24081 [Fusarium oxysporum f. sp. albedinis]